MNGTYRYAFLVITTALARPTDAQTTTGPWFVGAMYGRASYERAFATPASPCFKPCILPNIERGSTATLLTGRRIGDVLAVHASVSPFLDRSTSLYHCGGSGGLGPVNCAKVADFRRWIEYRFVVEAGAPGSVRPFVGGSLGGAGYRRFESEGRHHRLIWDLRAGIETRGRLIARVEVSRTQHLNPPWDGQGGKESFADWQMKAGVLVNLGSR